MLTVNFIFELISFQFTITLLYQGKLRYLKLTNKKKSPALWSFDLPSSDINTKMHIAQFHTHTKYECPLEIRLNIDYNGKYF